VQGRQHHLGRVALLRDRPEKNPLINKKK
jgi:hypothetical protein